MRQAERLTFGNIMRNEEVVVLLPQDIIRSCLDRLACLRFCEKSVPSVIGEDSARNPSRLVMNAATVMFALNAGVLIIAPLSVVIVSPVMIEVTVAQIGIRSKM